MKNKTGLEKLKSGLEESIKKGLTESFLPNLLTVIEKLIAEEKAELSLVKLADEKGYLIKPYKSKDIWYIELQIKFDHGSRIDSKSVEAIEYDECEDKARIYLRGIK